MSVYSRYGSRALDLAIGVPLVIVALPVMALVALALMVAQGTPVLFRQQRPGRAGVPFTLVKFRTMMDRRGADGNVLPDAERLSRVGRFLRSTSLDELPELFCVVRGDMSLVGPRPLLMEYLPLYSAEQARRHDVRPGLTGWAQIRGRNAVPWPERLRLDVWYVDHQSLLLDLRILAETVWRVLTREGISQPGHATQERFTGTE